MIFFHRPAPLITKVVITIVTTFSMLQKIYGNASMKATTSFKKNTTFSFLLFNKNLAL